MSAGNPSARGYIENNLGAGAVLLALLDPSLVPFCGYMGGKRKLAQPILRQGFGLKPGDGAREVVIAEAGPLGWVWSELLSERKAGAVVDALLVHRDRDPVELWEDLASRPPALDPAERAAQVLWIQGRSAGNTPISWSERRQRWEMGDTPYVDGRTKKQAIYLNGHVITRQKKAKAKGHNRAGFGGLISTASVAARLLPIARALSRLPVRFHHGDYADAIPAGDLSGWDIYWDPPYQGATSYAVDLPRARVLRDAQDFRARGATLAISEAVPLPLRRWRQIDLTREGGKPEWLTCSRWPVAEQVRMPFQVSA